MLQFSLAQPKRGTSAGFWRLARLIMLANERHFGPQLTIVLRLRLCNNARRTFVSIGLYLILGGACAGGIARWQPHNKE